MYKVLFENNVIDALLDLQCVKFQPMIGVIRCKSTEAPQGVISYDSNEIYHVEGWPDFPQGDYKTVVLQPIGSSEYESIRETLDQGLDVPVEPETPEGAPKTQAQLLQEQIDAMAEKLQQSASITGPAETTFVASRNYVKGEFLVAGGTMYAVIANIARGSRIIPNLNVITANLTDIFNSH